MDSLSEGTNQFSDVFCLVLKNFDFKFFVQEFYIFLKIMGSLSEGTSQFSDVFC